MTGLQVATVFPFGLHILAGVLTLYGPGHWQMDSTGLLHSFKDCFQLGPELGDITRYFAVIQIVCSLISAVMLHIGTRLSKTASYGLLVTMCAIMILRHFLSNNGACVIGCGYAHIFIFTILVFQHESTVLSPDKK